MASTATSDGLMPFFVCMMPKFGKNLDIFSHELHGLATRHPLTGNKQSAQVNFGLTAHWPFRPFVCREVYSCTRTGRTLKPEERNLYSLVMLSDCKVKQ